MASVTVAHCGEHGGGGNHLVVTVNVGGEDFKFHVTKDEFLSRDIDKEEKAKIIFNNAKIRAIKASARNGEEIKAAMLNVPFQEI